MAGEQTGTQTTTKQQLESQVTTLATVRKRIEKAILHGISESGSVPIGTASVLELAQALEIAVRNERQALIDIELRSAGTPRS
jgi:hypothetical protein